jgi:hypothetical protein
MATLKCDIDKKNNNIPGEERVLLLPINKQLSYFDTVYFKKT